MERQHLSQTKKAITSSNRESALAQLTEGIARNSPHPVKELQGAIGNRAVNQLLANQPVLQAKPMFKGLSGELRSPSPLQAKPAKQADSTSVSEVQPENKTGLPERLKAGIENYSGLAMDDVRVHYNSSKPSELQALAYTQGTDIHVAPGEEKHIPHEAWHIVQQKQGRVKPTIQTKGIQINDDKGLEHEADMMGAKASQIKQPEVLSHELIGNTTVRTETQNKPVQCMKMKEIWEWLKQKRQSKKYSYKEEKENPYDLLPEFEGENKSNRFISSNSHDEFPKSKPQSDDSRWTSDSSGSFYYHSSDLESGEDVETKTLEELKKFRQKLKRRRSIEKYKNWNDAESSSRWSDSESDEKSARSSVNYRNDPQRLTDSEEDKGYRDWWEMNQPHSQLDEEINKIRAIEEEVKAMKKNGKGNGEIFFYLTKILNLSQAKAMDIMKIISSK